MCIGLNEVRVNRGVWLYTNMMIFISSVLDINVNTGSDDVENFTITVTYMTCSWSVNASVLVVSSSRYVWRERDKQKRHEDEFPLCSSRKR